MALKFLNKKGWHTGSLRNIENVWKAEQKHEAEQKKLEELRKQIHEERERAEFRQLQEQAGLIPRQERLDFLYDSGLAVGKKDSGFKALESLPKVEPETAAASSSSTAKQQESAVPGALFEDKPHSTNDAWRKLHSDPLLMIRQREQEALARIKNNPVQMAMIRKSVESQKDKGKDEKKQRKKHHNNKSKRKKHSSSENDSDSEDKSMEKQRVSHHKDSRLDKHAQKGLHTSNEKSDEMHARKVSYYEKERGVHRRSSVSGSKYDRREDRDKTKNNYDDSRRKEYSSERNIESRNDKRSHFYSSEKPPRSEPNSKEYSSERNVESQIDKPSHVYSSDKPPRSEPNSRRRNATKLSEEERAARLKEMQMDAELHEEQRWKRLKKAADEDAEEAIHDKASSGRNFLDAAQKSVYGAEKGGSSTIEESVRRRTHYSQGRLATDTNAFRRS